MTSSVVLADNAYGTIGTSLAVGDTAMNFTTGHGARFPAVLAGQVLYCTLIDTTNIVEEIEITAHTANADTATIVRGQNSTTAKAWSAGTRIEARLSSAVLRRVQQEALNEVTLTTADGGATYTGTASPSLVGYVQGVVYALTVTASNSGANPTIAVNGLSAITVKLDGTIALTAGQMPNNGLYKYDGTNLILLNPVLPHGSQTFLVTSTFTAAPGVTSGRVTMQGGGGGGSGGASVGASTVGWGGIGGQGGAVVIKAALNFTASQVVVVTIGTGGTAGAAGGPGGSGGLTSFGTFTTASGGNGGGSLGASGIASPAGGTTGSPGSTGGGQNGGLGGVSNAGTGSPAPANSGSGGGGGGGGTSGAGGAGGAGGSGYCTVDW